MKLVRSIDLWTEQKDNHEECFNGAFIDGFNEGNIPFDEYKVVKNCNCEITCNDDSLNITNKHAAIVFYKDGIPVRLLVINEGTDINACIKNALEQTVFDIPLSVLLQSIKTSSVDLGMEHIHNGANHDKEVDIGSCDRPDLLNSMLKGSYTESDTGFGKENNNTDFNLDSNIVISYNLLTDNEWFFITHHNAFINDDKSRVIPLQDHSKLNIDEIKNTYGNPNNKKHL